MSTTTFKVHLVRCGHGRMELRDGAPPLPPPVISIPARVARLVALAHHIENLVRAGKVRDYAAIAMLGGITRARVSQITNLLLL
ncbi:MAG TPA: hypothetical protein VHC70_08065, partial [Phycisphaerales bacterium]|nr:hypothetical protein [Phycisphaerales bacterium]